MPKMARLNGIKSYQCYTFQEAADITGVSIRTIRNWGRNGLQLLDCERPILIRGDMLRDYIKTQRNEAKVKTGKDEFYCLSCRKARRAAGGMADCIITGNRAKLIALCETCETVMHKPVALDDVQKIGRILDLTITGHAPTL